MKEISKIIHQTWKENHLPPHLEILAETWRDAHPDWEYKLWTDQMNRDFIHDNYPDFLDKYDKYPREIQRIDAFRYFLLLKEGGLYVDLDFECIVPITSLITNEQCVIGKEPNLHCERFSMDMILCNAFMAASSGNDFMRFVCDKIIDHPYKKVVSQKEVLNSTGPFILTRAYAEYEKKKEILILEPETIYPLNMYETRHVFHDTLTVEMQERVNNAYAIHYFLGGW